MAEQKPEQQWADVAWVLAVGGQAGLMLAAPVLLGLVVGYLIDQWLGSLPWITLLLTFVGIIVGPIYIYRWVLKTVKVRLEHKGPDHAQKQG